MAIPAAAWRRPNEIAGIPLIQPDVRGLSPVGHPLGNQYADGAIDDGYAKPTHASAITAEQEQRHDKQKEDCLPKRYSCGRREFHGSVSKTLLYGNYITRL